MGNMSDGKSDGIIIMYVKDETIYPVALTQTQVQLLDISIGAVFADDKLTVIFDKSQGNVKRLEVK